MDWQYLSICSVLGINMRFSLEDININFPKNCFGIIVTIKRGRKLNKYPSNVHGISKIWRYPNSIPRNKIVDYIIKCSRKAYNDERSKYFEDILFDRKASIEVTFMIKDIERIFNNYDHNRGILIAKNDKYIDSYLPGSFEAGSGWLDVKNYVMDKYKDNKIEFYSFPIQTTIIDISDIFDKCDFTNYWIRKLCANINIRNKIPYILKNNIKYYKSIPLDNIYCIDSLLRHRDILDKKTINNITSIIKEYIIDYKRYDNNVLFYLVNNTDNQDILEHFYNRIIKLVDDSTNRISEEEILLILSNKINSGVLDLDKKIEYILENRRDNINNREYNLHSTLFRSYINKGGTIKDIKRAIEQTLNTFHFDTLLESEEMVLLFESFCALHSVTKDDKLSRKVWILFVLLMRKINVNYWIQNKDGICNLTTTCRLLNALSFYQ